MHDFISFTEDDKTEKSTKVLIEDLQLVEAGDLILIRIVGSHFLWKMVRRIVGVLVEAGRGNLSKNVLEKFLNTFSDEPAKYTAPPSGLFLEQVFYKKEKLKKEIKPILNLQRFHSQF
jgi:tRNA pseudouridine38-40 synthase